MDYFGYIFYLGIVYVVFSIIWFFIALLPKYILGGNREERNWEKYLLKSIQYYFLASLTLLKATEFLTRKSIIGENVIYFYLIGGIILYLYLLGKYERNKQMGMFRFAFSALKNGKLKNTTTNKAAKFEPHLIGSTIVFYLVALQYPILVAHKVNYWFLESANDFYDTVIIKWILGVIGFFFMLSMIVKGISATGELIQYIIGALTGKPYVKKPPKNPLERFGGIGGFGGNDNKDPFGFTNNQNTEANKEEKVDLEDDLYVDFEYVDEEENEEQKE